MRQYAREKTQQCIENSCHYGCGRDKQRKLGFLQDNASVLAHIPQRPMRPAAFRAPTAVSPAMARGLAPLPTGGVVPWPIAGAPLCAYVCRGQLPAHRSARMCAQRPVYQPNAGWRGGTDPVLAAVGKSEAR